MNMYINQKYTCQNVKKKKPFHFFFPKDKFCFIKEAQCPNMQTPPNRRTKECSLTITAMQTSLMGAFFRKKFDLDHRRSHH